MNMFTPEETVHTHHVYNTIHASAVHIQLAQFHTLREGELSDTDSILLILTLQIVVLV